ncbi:hypothetical protein BJY52DRAFT_1120356 [Lactarius psammicola]|nr:hypothetical protein BJY52DRAFT_1120356 [Lactarius psammicola]
MSAFMLLIHGDLLMKEQLDTIRDSRRIEDTPKNRFQFVVFLLGLFHYKMACVDTLWRTYLLQEGRGDLNSTYQHVGILRLRETGIMTTKPGFRQMHDVVHHELHATILECWWREVSARNPGNMESLEVFAESKPDWDLVVKISEDIVWKYVAIGEDISQSHTRPDDERDQQFENQTLQNRDYLLYVDLCNAINLGDIGRVEASFLPWIYIFSATGKHKYTSQLARFMTNLHEVYPPALRQASYVQKRVVQDAHLRNHSNIVRMNLLCNLTGRPNAFHPVDWLVERNNLYTKVIYSGSGPNCTIEYICKQSLLIEVFRSCHTMVESAFQLTHCTLKHTPPDMTVTIERLRAYMQSLGTCEFQPGRVVEREILDNITKGLQVVHAKKTVLPVDEETCDIVATDLEAH